MPIASVVVERLIAEEAPYPLGYTFADELPGLPQACLLIGPLPHRWQRVRVHTWIGGVAVLVAYERTRRRAFRSRAAWKGEAKLRPVATKIEAAMVLYLMRR
ncbi:MAG: hypothetical protein ABI759_24205 [Candidatus Solibacter sp.]